jgi:hypothetical protein
MKLLNNLSATRQGVDETETINVTNIQAVKPRKTAAGEKRNALCKSSAAS